MLSLEKSHQRTNKYVSRAKRFKKQLFFQVLALMGMVYLAIFAYYPMFGVVMAFQNFNPGLGFLNSPFVGLDNFIKLFSDDNFIQALRNTILLSSTKFVLLFVTPIIFALTLNEVKNIRFKKVVQTASYLPYFVSWVVVTSMMSFVLSTERAGVVNELLRQLGIIDQPIPFLTYTHWYFIVAVVSDIWKSFGFNAIIYLAALAGIDEEMMEAAKIDGANRLQRILYITIPSIKTTMTYLLILGVAYIFSSGVGSSNFQQGYLLGNGLNFSISDVVETYTLRLGLEMGRFSFAAAAGLFLSALSLLTFLGANSISKKISDDSII